MKLLAAITKMLDSSGMNAMKLANAIGCTHATIFDLFSSKRDDVKAEELVSMAAAMGYEVVLRGHGEEIRIDPACKSQSHQKD